MKTAATITPRLVNVEDGYARVINAASGGNLGEVGREKHGSTRTGFRWVAVINSRRLGYALTREEAVALIVSRHEKVAAWKKGQS